MLTVSDVATRLHVSKSIIYQLIESGMLPCHRIGIGRGTIRVSESDLDAYLDSCREGPPEPRDRRPRRARLKHIKL
jgi:excisionase family DNA binding protein